MPASPRFVVQCHQAGDSVHWDLMLEQDAALATWHIPIPPEHIGAEPLAIERIFDHPKRFLDYEGPLRSHPGNVRIHDQGRYVPLVVSDTGWRVRIEGQRLRGDYRIERASGAGSSADRWTIARHGPPPLADSPTRSPA